MISEQARVVTGRILIVDDQASFRQKLSLALENLGHEPATADSGHAAVLALREQPFDLILLDILMPDMDGFEVMEFMRLDKSLQDIPVIVISALDGDTDNVVRAIEQGAEDFLPKQFSPVLLSARITSALEKKRHRDHELKHLRDVERLIEAAALLEKQVVDPERLPLQQVAEQQTDVGQLARVFMEMARRVYHREQVLLAQIRQIRGIGMLLAIGVIYGLAVPLTWVAASEAPRPFGLAFWTNTFCALICLPVAVYRRRLPAFTGATIRLFMVWGLLATLLGQVVLFWVAAHLSAVTLSIVVVVEWVLIVALAWLFKLERINTRRLLGSAIALTGVVVLLLGAADATGGDTWAWILVAMLSPLGYACRGLYVACRKPADLDPVAAAGLSAVAGLVLVTPLMLLLDDFVPLRLSVQPGESLLLLSLLLLSIISAAGTTLRVALLEMAGPVFAGQSSVAVTIAAICWSAALLGVLPAAMAWAALLLLIIGLLLVGLRDAPETADQQKTLRPLNPNIG